MALQTGRIMDIIGMVIIIIVDIIMVEYVIITDGGIIMEHVQLLMEKYLDLLVIYQLVLVVVSRVSISVMVKIKVVRTTLHALI